MHIYICVYIYILLTCKSLTFAAKSPTSNWSLNNLKKKKNFFYKYAY